jgi:type IV pilus assembly protein PilQ
MHQSQLAVNNAAEHCERAEKEMLTRIINNQSNGHNMNVSSHTIPMGKYLLQTITLFCLLSTLAFANTNPATETSYNSIQSVGYSSLPGNRIQITLEMSEKAVTPLSFTIDNPARIAFDFANTGSNLPKRSQPVGVGIAQSITTVSTKTKTRVILNLTEVVPYQVTTQGKNVLITLDSEATGTAFETDEITVGATQADSSRFSNKPRGIENIDFRRGEEGEGRVVINLSDANIPMDISEEFGKVVVKFLGIKLPDELRQTLDVLDFATPVKSVSSFEEDDDVRIEIEPVSSNYEHVAYQANNIFTIELKPISKEELEEVKKEKFGYTGERLSLNFQDIPVRAVLQLIADFTSLNVVVSDSVDGNLTLRLKNVPWDQALDIILKAKGLSKRESGTVMMIAPSEEIAAQEKIDLEAQQSITELAPIRSAFFTINFAKVTELSALFTGAATGGEDGEEGGTASGGILSPRGSIIIDERTNTLIVKDTEEVISEIRRTLKKLDIPIRQVMISSRIVVAQDKFTKELGSRLGLTKASTNSDGFGVTTGTFQGADSIASSGITNIQTTGSPEPFSIPSGINAAERLNVDLGTTGAAGSLAFAVLTGSTLIDLEISALQAENQGEVISSPRVVTADRHEAHIEQGVEIPYLSASSSGATQIEFKKAVLSIVVTPHITPDDRVIMDLAVTNDTVGEVYNTIPSIDTREVGTQVLVNNGDTVVLGGIYQQITRDEVDKVPFLGDIPLIGYFFRHTLESDERRELLIFVTPKILKDALSL